MFMTQATPWQDRVIPEPNSGCLLWEGAVSRNGYGHIRRGGKDIILTRLVWEEAHGPIPDGLHVCHRCDVPACVNIDHLFLGTPSDNIQDAWTKGRVRTNRDGFLRNKTHCAQGHPYVEQNIGITPYGHRFCRRCKLLYMQRYAVTKKAELGWKPTDSARAERATGRRKVVRRGRSCWARPGDEDYPT